MANLHTLLRSGVEVTVAAHIAVPVGNNSAGVAWAMALLNSGLGGKTVLKDGDGTGGTISAAEKAAIVAGTVVEAVDTVRTDSVFGGAATINAYLDAQYILISNRTLTWLQDVLRWFGGTRG